jgi:hypothetical protein
MNMLLLWVFTSKFIKLLGHYIRYPVDVFLLPVSVLFGYFHGAIKMYAVMTLNVVSNLVSGSIAQYKSLYSDCPSPYDTPL